MSSEKPSETPRGAVTNGIIYEYEDGGRYCGEWSDNLAHGHGICTGPQNEGLYEGQWEKGNQVSGIYSWSSGQKYYGQWKDGYRHGCGKEVMPDGTEYTGDFSNDHREGFGVVRRPSGDLYRGSWKGGLQDGEGVEEYLDGGIYRGEFRDGMRHGYGTRCSLAYESQQQSASASSTLARRDSQSPNHVGAQSYSGQWQSNKRHGYGVLEVPGSFTYYGEWKENARTGYGVLVRKDNTKEEGEWLNGSLAVVLKRGKVSLLHLKLDSKVKQAHTMALQAVKTAASRVTVAESRAASARSRAQTGTQEAKAAQKAALVAQERSKLHANAPIIPEVVKSPVQETPMDIAIKPNTIGNHLSVSNTVLSTSFENLTFLPSEKRMFMVPSSSEDSNVDESNMEGSIRSISSFESDQNSVDGALETTSLTVPPDYRTPSISIISPSSSLTPTRCVSESDLRHRRNDTKRPSLCILPEEKAKRASVSRGQRPDFIDHTTGVKGLQLVSPSLGVKGLQMVSPSLGVKGLQMVSPSLGETFPEGVDEGTEANARDVEVQETKGEVQMNNAVITSETAGIGNDQVHVQHRSGANADVLMQIAMWNRSMTYINILLLIVLLVLIIATVISLYYVMTPAHLQSREVDYLFQPLAA
ncbi:hypothetical protein EMCRGX_G030855 [Ephydatia muelleri]